MITWFKIWMRTLFRTNFRVLDLFRSTIILCNWRDILPMMDMIRIQVITLSLFLSPCEFLVSWLNSKSLREKRGGHTCFWILISFLTWSNAILVLLFHNPLVYSTKTPSFFKKRVTLLRIVVLGLYIVARTQHGTCGVLLQKYLWDQYITG